MLIQHRKSACQLYNHMDEGTTDEDGQNNPCLHCLVFGTCDGWLFSPVTSTDKLAEKSIQ